MAARPVTSPAKTDTRTSSALAPRRISFGRITEHLEVPDLLAIQTQSFDWLVGNEAWQARSAGDPYARSGLDEILEEISPIEDFSGTMSLSFSSPRFDEVKAPIEECREKDLTYCAPLFVTAEFTNNTTGEIPAVVSGNTITESLVCVGNQPPPTNVGQPNTVTGATIGQCAGL